MIGREPWNWESGKMVGEKTESAKEVLGLLLTDTSILLRPKFSSSVDWSRHIGTLILWLVARSWWSKAVCFVCSMRWRQLRSSGRHTVDSRCTSPSDSPRRRMWDLPRNSSHCRQNWAVESLSGRCMDMRCPWWPAEIRRRTSRHVDGEEYHRLTGWFRPRTSRQLFGWKTLGWQWRWSHQLFFTEKKKG